MADFKVHVKRTKTSQAGEQTDSYEKVPYFCLPGIVAEEAIAPSCLTCFDYTNGLADLVVGYMGAPLDDNGEMTTQWQQVKIFSEGAVS